MATNTTSVYSNMESPSHLSQDYRRLTFNYDFHEKRRAPMCFSPPLSSSRPRDMSIPRLMTRQCPTDINVAQGPLIKALNAQILSKAKHLVNNAIVNKKIFSIYGPYDKIRQTLKARGWVEKLTDNKVITSLHNKLNQMIEKGNTNDNLLSGTKDESTERKGSLNTILDIDEKVDIVASLLVLNCSADLIWTLRLGQVDEQSLKPNQMINHFKKAGSFTTKIGLIKTFNYLRWYEKDNDEVFPRSYILADENERKAFLDDYYLTACMSLIKITAQFEEIVPQPHQEERFDGDVPLVVKTDLKCDVNKVKPLINYNTKEVGASNFKINVRFLEMAVHYCDFFLKYHNNKDLDQRQVVFCSQKRWEEFFENYNYVISEGYGIESNESIRKRCKLLCQELKKIHPQFNLDGTKNIWIIKPGAKSRGRGIFCASKFSEINDVIRTTSETLIVQKYIENPLLVYKTKFDIRQWFLVTSWSPLTIWWYKDSYIRFCSQQFTLNDLNESVHLSNNSIQHKYQNGKRSNHLPAHNMWEWERLEKYLNESGYKDGWKKQILPSMKDIIVDILLCSQEEIDDRKNSFELYGADFMVTAHDLKTWLLEINSSPCMSASTDVTAKLTRAVLDDLIKVIFDYPNDVLCDTGQFELLFKQAPFSKPLVEHSERLTIYGFAIKKPTTINSQFLKRELMSARKNGIPDEESVLRTKLRMVIDNCVSYKDLQRPNERQITANEPKNRSAEIGVKQLSTDWRNKRIQGLTDQIDSADHRRSHSQTQYVMNKLSSSFIRNEATKSYNTPAMTNSLCLNKGEPVYMSTAFIKNGSKSYIRSLQPIKKNSDNQTSRQQHKPLKPFDKSNHLRASNDERPMLTKVTTWKQMDKSQRSEFFEQRIRNVL